jgi:hypothetical protein
MKTTYRFNIPDTMVFEDDYEFKSNFDEEDGDWLAEQAAENYHQKHDGWESSWPITFIIRKEDGSEIGRYEVDREIAPQFFARKVSQ